MKKVETYWTSCGECHGRGKTSRKLRKKVRLRYQKAVELYEKTDRKGSAPIRPKRNRIKCLNCNGTGLLASESPLTPDQEHYPHIAIIGGGIGGVALALACKHRGIPFTLYERDNSFDARSQGYGLTLQQASKVIEALGISTLQEGVISTRHVVHTTDGNVIGEWGMRKWSEQHEKKKAKRTNIHIARQSLRMELLEQLGGDDAIKWGYQFKDYSIKKDNKASLNFIVDGKIVSAEADLVVGADGIRSTVRSLLINEELTPLRYLNCIVILGICPLESLNGLDHPLLDSATVFQTANGNERIYMMPFTQDTIMWQLSFPMKEKEAKLLSLRGSLALKKEAQRRTKWHDPIPQIIESTDASLISGYPVYDRKLLTPHLLENAGSITLIGDAAHPMSPFKGQGANQALIDALSLARKIAIACQPLSNWRKKGIRKSVLSDFESEMIARSAVKVKASADAAQFLHTDIVLHEGDEPRGKCIKLKTKGF